MPPGTPNILYPDNYSSEVEVPLEISTAAFGSKYEKHVQVLRRFRNLYLTPNRIGRAFVKGYYRHSPKLTDFIGKHDILGMLVRWGLVPLIAVSWMLLQFGPGPTLLLIGLMFSGTFIIAYRKINSIGKKYFSHFVYDPLG